jgi:hypothetical protein
MKNIIKVKIRFLFFRIRYSKIYKKNKKSKDKYIY